MNKIKFPKRFPLLILLALATLFAVSCEAILDNLPLFLVEVHLVPGAGYISSDTTVDHGVNVKFAVHATSLDKSNALVQIRHSVWYNGKADSTVSVFRVPSVDSLAVDHNFSINTQNTAGTERHSFTVMGKRGDPEGVFVTLTVR